MRVAIVLQGMPQPSVSGGAIAMWSLIGQLRAAGHEVACVVLLPAADREVGADELARRSSALGEEGVEVELLDLPADPPPPRGKLDALRRLVAASAPEAYFGSAPLAAGLERLLAGLAPDVILAFDTTALVALHGARPAPALAIPGDPRGQVWRQQLRIATPRERLGRTYLAGLLAYVLLGRRLDRYVVTVARSFDAVAMFGAQHAAELEACGVPCSYLPIPVVDRIALPADELAGRPASSPLRVLVLGGLRSTATQLGFQVLIDDMLPRLESSLQAGELELVIAGSGTMPTRFHGLLERPGVRLAGFVADSAAEMAAADVFLVPSPYRVGARTRVVEALSAGCAIVAHELCASGLPELRHEENALLAASGRGLADELLRVSRDEALRVRLRHGARATYEAHFRPAIACAGLIAELEALAGRARSVEPSPT